MKLQKLVYTARVQHLGFTDDKPPTDEAIQAWRFGPGLVVLYLAARVWSGRKITEPVLPYWNDDGEPEYGPDDESFAANSIRWT